MSFLEEVKSFARNRLKTVDTRVTTVDGRVEIFRHVDAGSNDDRPTSSSSTRLTDQVRHPGYVVDLKPDLQIGQVLPFLSFGSQDVVHDVALLRKHSVTHVLNVTTGINMDIGLQDSASSSNAIVYKRVELLDLPEVDVRRVLDECFDYIDGHRDGHVLVHCNAGVSRSATIVIAYLMSRCRMRLNDALQHVRAKRPAARPNDGFMQQLRAYDEELELANRDNTVYAGGNVARQ